jgi:hypothetical protein
MPRSSALFRFASILAFSVLSVIKARFAASLRSSRFYGWRSDKGAYTGRE